jgi:hypothetical protein
VSVNAIVQARRAHSFLLTHFPDGRIVTPRKMAAAKAAALSFLPPLAAFTAAILAAAFCRSILSVIWGDLFFFFGTLVGDAFFCFFAEEGLGVCAGAGRFTPGLAGFDAFLRGFELAGGCCAPYIGICLGGGGGGWCGGG